MTRFLGLSWHAVSRARERRQAWWRGVEWWARSERRCLLKGWWTAFDRRCDYLELMAALGGEDGMAQVGFVVPWLGRAYVGVAVPRRFLHAWVYERREFGLRVGYIGNWIELLLGRDETLESVSDLRAERRNPHGGQCRHCRAPGYCHTFAPPEGWGAYEMVWTVPGTAVSPARRRRRVFAAPGDEVAAAYVEGNDAYLHAQVRPVPMPDASCWGAIGTKTPHVNDCPGWEKKPPWTTPAQETQGPRLVLRPRLLDRLLGPYRYEYEDLDAVEAAVPMPEGSYPCTVTRHRWTRGRARWAPGRRHGISCDVRMAVPIPVPGKGESEWDCDDDALFSGGTRASTVGEALGEFAGKAMRTRERYAALGWEPREGWPDGVVVG
jgi:hypothetical protein